MSRTVDKSRPRTLGEVMDGLRRFARRWSRFLVLLEDLPEPTELAAIHRHLARPGEWDVFAALNGSARARAHRSERPEEAAARAALGPLPADLREFFERYGSVSLLYKIGRGYPPFAIYLPDPERAHLRGSAVLHVLGAEEALAATRALSPPAGRIVLALCDMPVARFYGTVELEPGTGDVFNRDLAKGTSTRVTKGGFTSWLADVTSWLLPAVEKWLVSQGVAPASEREAAELYASFASAAAGAAPAAPLLSASASLAGPALVDACVADLASLAARSRGLVLLEALAPSAAKPAALAKRIGEGGKEFIAYHRPNLARHRRADRADREDLAALVALAGKLPPSYAAFFERWGSLTLLSREGDPGTGTFLPGNVSGQGEAVSQLLRAGEARDITEYVRNLIVEAGAPAYACTHLLVFHGGWMREGFALDLKRRDHDGECPVIAVDHDQILASAYGPRGRAPRVVAPSFAAWLAAEVTRLAAALS